MVVQTVCNAAKPIFSTIFFPNHPEDMLRMWEVMKQDEEVKEELYEEDSEQDGTDAHEVELEAEMEGIGLKTAHTCINSIL